jgi:hypothetical protein
MAGVLSSAGGGQQLGNALDPSFVGDTGAAEGAEVLEDAMKQLGIGSAGAPLLCRLYFALPDVRERASFLKAISADSRLSPAEATELASGAGALRASAAGADEASARRTPTPSERRGGKRKMRKKVAEEEDEEKRPPELLPLPTLLKIVADMYTKKISEDALAELKGRERARMPKVAWHGIA